MIYKPKDYKELTHIHLEKLEQNNEFNSLRFGIQRVDHQVKLFKSDLGVILARPGHGKTALMLSFVRNACDVYLHNPNEYAPPIYITKETSIEELVLRNLANYSGIDLKRMKDGDKVLDWTELHKSVDKMVKKFPLIFVGHSLYNQDDRKAINAQTAVDCIKEIHDEYGNASALVSIDYLQRFSLPGFTDSRLMFSNIVELFKDTAMEENTAIMLGSQALREVDKMAFPVPTGEHSKETGNIEETCDLGISSMRPLKYWKVNTPIPATDPARLVTPELFFMDIWKQRSGETNMGYWLQFDMRIYELSDLEK